MSIVKVSIIFTLVSLLSKFIGMFRDMLVAHVYGASYITDAYSTAMSIPNFLYMVGISSILITFIPNFCEIINESDNESAYDFSNKFLSVLLILATILLISIFIFTDTIVKLMVPGFNEEVRILTIKLTRIMSINIIFMVITAVYSSILRVKQKMIAVTFMPLAASLPIVIYLLFNRNTSVIWVATITCLGYLLQFIILIPESLKCKYRFKFILRGYNHRLISILKGIMPLTFGLAVSQISIVVDKLIASKLPQGSITSIDLSSKVSSILYSVLMSSITTVFYPQLSKLFIQDKLYEWCKYIEKLIKVILILIVPLTALLLVLNKEIIEMLFQRGNFTEYGTILTTSALAGYAIQLPFLAITDIIAQGLYSSKDTKTVPYNGVIVVFTNIVLTIILSRSLGVFGITFATSISTVISGILFLYIFNKKYNSFDMYSIFKFLIRIFLITLLNLFIIYVVKRKILLITNNNFIIVSTCGLLGIIIQALGYFLINKKEIKELITFAKK